MVDYDAFVRGLRLPLGGRRLQIVERAFCAVGCSGDKKCESVTVAQARAAFKYEEFDKFCELMGVSSDDASQVPWSAFCEFYSDISMVSFEDKAFI